MELIVNTIRMTVLTDSVIKQEQSSAKMISTRSTACVNPVIAAGFVKFVSVSVHSLHA